MARANAGVWYSALGLRGRLTAGRRVVSLEMQVRVLSPQHPSGTHLTHLAPPIYTVVADNPADAGSADVRSKPKVRRHDGPLVSLMRVKQSGRDVPASYLPMKKSGWGWLVSCGNAGGLWRGCGRMTPLSLLYEITLLRVTTPPLFTWDDLLPDQAKRLPTELAHIDAYLDDERFIAPWRAHFHARLGRPSIPIPTLLRLLYLKHRYQLGYESLCKEVGDSISWRRFCRIPLDRPVPHPTTLSKLAHRCGPGVTDQLNAALLAKLAADKLLRARKLRIDTTVVAADIDYPTDADLLEGAVGKLGRLVRRIKAQGAASRTRFRDRGRAAGRRMKQLSHALRRRGGQTMAEVDRLADPDARPIRKGKPQRPTEFGYTLLLAEDERGFVADHQLQQGNPLDAPQLVPAVARVAQVTGRVAATVVGDRGFGTAAGDRDLAELGIKRVGVQRKGRLSMARAEVERTRAFRRMRNWRVGIEARISHLKRSFGLRRTRLRRLAGAKTWVGLGIFAYNLQRMTVVAAR